MAKDKRLTKSDLDGLITGQVFQTSSKPGRKDGVDVARKGTLCINQSNGKVYINVGNKRKPNWQKVPKALVPNVNFNIADPLAGKCNQSNQGCQHQGCKAHPKGQGNDGCPGKQHGTQQDCGKKHSNKKCPKGHGGGKPTCSSGHTCTEGSRKEGCSATPRSQGCDTAKSQGCSTPYNQGCATPLSQGCDTPTAQGCGTPARQGCLFPQVQGCTTPSEQGCGDSPAGQGCTPKNQGS